MALAVGAAVFLGGGDDETPDAPDPSVAATTPSDPPDATKADLVDTVNAHRQEQGLAPVTVDPQLAREAQAHAETAAAQGDFPPTDEAIGTRHPGRWFAIYTAAIAGDSPADAQANAIESPTTEPNLVKPATDVIGVGLAEGEDGTTYLVEYLAQRN